MSHDPRALANYLLDLADNKGITISNLSLQKIAFFAHADFLRSHNSPLVNKHFEAWKYGPVSPSLYHEFKKFGDGPIRGRATKLDFETGNSIVVDSSSLNLHHDFLSAILDTYGHLSSSALVNLSHSPGGAWDTVWNKDGRGISGLVISDRIILNTEGKTPNLGDAQHVN